MNHVIKQEDEECWKMFQERSQKEQTKWWADRAPQLRQEHKREDKGVYYLALSIISIIGGFAGLIYGLVGKDWIQKPYVVMSVVMILIGLSIVIGGFGRVKE